MQVPSSQVVTLPSTHFPNHFRQQDEHHSSTCTWWSTWTNLIFCARSTNAKLYPSMSAFPPSLICSFINLSLTWDSSPVAPHTRVASTTMTWNWSSSGALGCPQEHLPNSLLHLSWILTYKAPFSCHLQTALDGAVSSWRYIPNIHATFSSHWWMAGE